MLLTETAMQRRRVLKNLVLSASALAATALLMGCKPKSTSLEGVDISGAAYGKDFPARCAGQTSLHSGLCRQGRGGLFGYTQCPDVCPTTLQELAEVKELLGAQGDRVQGVFISVDPERDTPEILQAYTQAFDPGMVALTGTPEQIAAVAKDFKVFYKKVEGKQPGSYTVDHSAGLYVYDPKGQLRVYHRYGQGAQALAKDVQALLNESTS